MNRPFFMSAVPSRKDRCIRCLKPVPSEAAACPSCQARVVSQMAIGQILVEERLVRPHQLEEALEIQRGTGRRLGNILTEKGYVSEREFAATLARQLDIPFFELEEYIIDPAVVSLIPEHLCERYRLIPIMKTGERLLVALSDPLNQDALDDIQMLTGLTLKVVVATPGDINTALAAALDALALREELSNRVWKGSALPASRPDRARSHLRKVR
jgi:type IV pilus assembly protein PilB